MRASMLFMIGSLLCSSSPFADAPPRVTAAVPADTRSLQVTPPRTKSAPGLLFDRLAGTWDVSYEIYAKDGQVRLYHGQVTYSRILAGGALQELWTSDSQNKEPQPYSTTIGFGDSTHRLWTAVWVYPAKGSVSIVRGGEVDGRIVLTGRDADGTVQRWSINDVQRDSFDWHFESSSDEGKTWRLVGVNHMRRHDA